jgi:predicted nucleic acid-binding Zn ribbon protein
MPIYVYELDIDDDSRQQRFEIFQKMTDLALTHHPETGAKIRRVVSAPYVPRSYHGQSTDKTLSDKNLDRLGFTKYVKTDHGYEKRTGSGPEKLGGP